MMPWKQQLKMLKNERCNPISVPFVTVLNKNYSRTISTCKWKNTHASDMITITTEIFSSTSDNDMFISCKSILMDNFGFSVSRPFSLFPTKISLSIERERIKITGENTSDLGNTCGRCFGCDVKTGTISCGGSIAVFVDASRLAAGSSSAAMLGEDANVAARVESEEIPTENPSNLIVR